MLGWAVDGIDGAQHPTAVVEDREFAALRISAGHDLIEPVGDTRRLEADVELVGPEPWGGFVGRRLAGDGASDVDRLVDGVLHGFEADSSAGERIWILGAIADGEDLRVGCT